MVGLSGIILFPSTFAENVPDWVKNTAGWWATDVISESEFVNAIEFLVKENIIQVDVAQTSETSQNVPAWVKNTAGWWATDIISESEFVNAIAYLIKVGIISIESSKSPELIAEMWVNGYISDDKFLENIDNLIEKDIITIQSDSVTKMSDHPDWLVNNAGWWAARIFTDSDFNFQPGYVKEEIYPCEEFSGEGGCFKKTFNSYGFRGPEFQEQKHEVDLRIFTLGGSTTFGVAAKVDETWPAHLQRIINEKITDKKIEVINFGKSDAQTEIEYKIIEKKISSLDPDLIIMYDGWNEFRHKIPTEKTILNWESICKLGKSEGFDTVIIVQPIPLTGYRVLTDQEITNSFSNFPYLQSSQQYIDAFKELDDVCTKTADFRGIFDYVQEPIFYDGGHTMNSGNKIIAENVFSVISPIYFGKTYPVIHSLDAEKKELETSVVYAAGSDLSNRNFDNLNLQNAVFDKADLSNTSFKNTNIDGARFAFANLSNSNLFDRIDLSNINLAGTDLSNISLKGKDLSGANLSYVDLSKHDLTGTNLTGVNLSHAKVSNADLKGKDLSGVNLSYVDLSKHDLTGTNLSNSMLWRTNLSGIDLSSTTIANVISRYANLSESNLPDSLLNNNFNLAKLMNINFAGKDLEGSSFERVELEGSDMQNTNLYGTVFLQVDFTKIKNKSLAGANLSDSSFAHSNLSGVNLDDTTVFATNFWNANLSDLDFTVVSDAQIDEEIGLTWSIPVIQGSTFIESNLSNSNFEGVMLSPTKQYHKIFKDKAYLIPPTSSLSATFDPLMLKNELFGEFTHILVLSSVISGNDLAVDFIFYNSFARANLENANFKNAGLAHANFYSANLTNADLSGADLRQAFLSGADLSNANLEGANLEDVILDNAILLNANLRCVNHPICESG
jgi:uncharacterized protein YjbI with pentapeptide repeats/lysophospholipase L1-like esterase